MFGGMSIPKTGRQVTPAWVTDTPFLKNCHARLNAQGVLTLNLILFYQLLEADVLFNGLERLFTTLLGIAFALGIIVLDYLAKR